MCSKIIISGYSLIVVVQAFLLETILNPLCVLYIPMYRERGGCEADGMGLYTNQLNFRTRLSSPPKPSCTILIKVDNLMSEASFSILEM